MNQDDSRFFQDLPLRSGARNIHGEVSFLSAQRDVKVFDRLTLSFFHGTILFFFIWGDIATGTKSFVCAAILRNEFRSSCGDVCCPAI